MTLRTLLTAQKGKLALLVGNGINRYGPEVKANSWDDLLNTLARKHLNPSHKQVPPGISLTEFYDVLELANKGGKSESGSEPYLQKQFCDLMSGWLPLAQHQRIARWAQAHTVPVLTTNFESTLGDAVQAKLHHAKGVSFTAYYPWESCYSAAPVDDPCSQFAVWHLNGMQRYRQSVRLGLSHYMGSVERARNWLHKGSNRLSAGGDPRDWAGAKTWLQVLFHQPLLIFGLALAENEVFLRWLLIERAKYHRKFKDRAQPAWYVHTAGEKDLGKLFFLSGVGVQPFKVESYDEIYGEGIWSLTG